MIPDEETALLTNTVFRAVDLAREGPLADGHAELVYGLRRVEAVREEALETGTHADWMPEVLVRWRVATDRYCEQYGARLEIGE